MPRTTSPALAPRTVDHLVAVDQSDAGAHEIELALLVDAGQLRGLAAEDRASRRTTDLGRSLDELRDLVQREAVGGDVVEEEERVPRPRR